jgi:hypothetical protein
MRKLLLVAILVPATAVAAPFVVSDPLAAGVTHCGVLLDAQPKQIVAVTVEAGESICKFNLAGISVGSHNVRMTAQINDPIWGSLESAESSPLTFVKPGVPATPGGLGLTP